RVAHVGPRTLVIGTLVDGATTFRLPHTLAARLPIVDADRAMIDSALSLIGPPVVATAVAGELWKILETAEPDGTAEEVRVWRAAERALDSEWVLRRYLTRASHLLADLDTRFEALSALVLGRPAYEVSSLAKILKATAPQGLNLDAEHRRFAKFVEK